MKVLFAYCHELGRSVSIDEARVEYFALEDQERKRFTFTCDDHNCRVTITGVNYHLMAEEDEKFITPHFRSRTPHHQECEWRKFTEEREQGQRCDEPDDDYKERKLKSLLHDYVDSFDPFIAGDDKEVNTDTETLTQSRSHASPSAEPKEQTGEPRKSRCTHTSKLQRFIDTWQEAKNKLKKEEFNVLTINIVNYCRVPYSEYVTHISKGLHNPHDGVIFGGVTDFKPFGDGFRIRFYDKVNGKKVILYVDKTIVGRSRQGRYVKDILNTPDIQYFKVYLLNPTFSDRIDTGENPVTNLEITDLRQMVVYLGARVKTKADDSASEESDG
ncbi:hypothetical protein [Serratia fonticola]|uniref:hypothetical protein n=1 Tax=Serratia fonticola TaxID=47917 RepID=UPI00301B8A17